MFFKMLHSAVLNPYRSRLTTLCSPTRVKSPTRKSHDVQKIRTVGTRAVLDVSVPHSAYKPPSKYSKATVSGPLATPLATPHDLQECQSPLSVSMVVGILVRVAERFEWFQ
jgi:hypothetical protein